MKKPNMLQMRSIVSGQSLEPYIEVVMMYDDGTEDKVTQWTPKEGYHHVVAVMRAIEAANTDAFLVAFLTEKLGMTLDQAGPVLLDFREWRDSRRPSEKTQ